MASTSSALLDLTNDDSRLQDETTRIHNRDQGVTDIYRCHVRLAGDWDGQLIRFTDPFYAFVREKHLRIRSHDGRLLLYERIPSAGASSFILIHYDSPVSMKAGTQFSIQFEYVREWKKRLLSDSFDVGAKSPTGPEPPKITIRMPPYYYIADCRILKPPNGSVGPVGPIGELKVDKKQLRDKERVVIREEDGRLYREYLFILNNIRDGAGRFIGQQLRYRIRLARRYHVMIASAIALPLVVSVISSLSILSPRLSTGEKLIATLAALAFGPPFVISMRQLFLDEVVTHTRGSRIDTAFAVIMFIAPLIPILLIILALWP